MMKSDQISNILSGLYWSAYIFLLLIVKWWKSHFCSIGLLEGCGTGKKIGKVVEQEKENGKGIIIDSFIFHYHS